MRWITGRMLALSIGCVAAGTPLALAQEAPKAAGVEVREKVVTQVYNISDIIYGARNYPFSSALIPPALTERPATFGSGGGGGGGLFGAASMPEERDSGAEARKEAIEELSQMLMQTIAPDSWLENGGTVGTIRNLGGKLIITQTEPSHARITQLLKEIKGSSKTARTVTVAARWIRLAPEKAADVVAKPETLKNLPADATIFRGAIRCLDGQTVHVQSGTGRTTVVDADPVVGENAAMFDLEVRLLHSGLSLQVTPQVDSEGKTALVDIHSIFSDRKPDAEPIVLQHVSSTATTQPAAGGLRTESSAKVDRLEVVSQQMQTSLRLRLGQSTLVGGMTIEPVAKGDATQLYLVLDVSVETVAP